MEYDYGRSSGQGSGGFGPLYQGRTGSGYAQANSNAGSYYPRVGQSSMGRAPPQAPLMSSPSFPCEHGSEFYTSLTLISQASCT